MNTDQPTADLSGANWQRDLSLLLEWMRTQKGGADTFYEFQRRARALRADNQRYAALLRILADMALRFADRFDGEPLEMTIASEAWERLTGYVQQAACLNVSDARAHLDLLNQMGLVELTPLNRTVPVSVLASRP